MKKRSLTTAAICFIGLCQIALSQTKVDQGKIILEQNKSIIRGYMNDIINKGDLAVFDRYFSDDTIFNKSKGVKQQLAGMQAIRSAFPDFQLIIEDQIAEGDKVVTRVTFQGTHRGEFRGIAPTGKQIRYTGIAIDRIENGKVVEMWHEADTIGMLQQMGATLSPGAKK